MQAGREVTRGGGWREAVVIFRSAERHHLMKLPLNTAEATAVKMSLSAAVVATLLSCCLHAAGAWDERTRVVCPLTNVKDEHTKIVTVNVIKVNPVALPAIHLNTHTSTTYTSLTSTVCLIRSSSMITSTVEVRIIKIVITS